MNRLTLPPTLPGGSSDPEANVDALLRSFFRAEVPDPWPAFEIPASPRVLPLALNGHASRSGPTEALPLKALPRRGTPGRANSVWHSRAALAASVALLLAGPLFLNGTFTGGPTRPETSLGSGTATRERIPELPGKPVGPPEAPTENPSNPLDGLPIIEVGPDGATLKASSPARE